jgi:dihydrolipoamide dehydrogenase
VERASRSGSGAVIGLDDGSEIEAAVLITVAGRTPRAEGIGLESVGVEASRRGVPIDDRCRVVRDGGEPVKGLWAVGDATGALLFTHIAQYHGRVAAANILGGSRRLRYEGVPRVVFSDPELATTGLTEGEAREAGMDVSTVTLDLAASLARPVTYERNPRGTLKLIADKKERVLVGAWAVAPLASEWIHQACLAIRERITVDDLLDSVAQFPTFSQAYLEALEKLEL